MRLLKLIKMSGRKNRTSLRARSNSFRCELDAEHQTGEQYSKQGKINAKNDMSTASLLRIRRIF